MRTTRLLVAGIVASVAIALAGCSGWAREHDEARVSIGSLLGLPDSDGVHWQDKAYQVQELISRCMRDEGWEYIPLVLPDWQTPWSSEDQAAQYAERGFGIAWSVLHNGEADPNDPYAGWVDPNQAYIDGLSESEQAAYYASLAGTEEEQAESLHTEIDPVTGMKTVTVGGEYGYGPGCSGEAHEDVYGENPSDELRRLEAVEVFYTDLQTRQEADPRVVELNEAWAQCMAQANYSYGNPVDVWNLAYPELRDRSIGIVGPNDATGLSAEQRVALEELLADEIALATAYSGCSEGYDAKISELYSRIEEQFALEHEEELRQLAATLHSGQS